jgi:hypothetical protein
MKDTIANTAPGSSQVDPGAPKKACPYRQPIQVYSQIDKDVADACGLILGPASPVKGQGGRQAALAYFPCTDLCAAMAKGSGWCQLGCFDVEGGIHEPPKRLGI